jgi:hypothetical protein
MIKVRHVSAEVAARERLPKTVARLVSTHPDVIKCPDKIEWGRLPDGGIALALYDTAQREEVMAFFTAEDIRELIGALSLAVKS